ncbi:hypothetical protein E2C01_093842 [Portunus trituberculatus]|uniref:Uncharacterized protein n=1 Tax=Portunus trituberculatus TaxID=210409 RepID=A0A5B7JNT5_PORTR|nr:hypothetical protein [Portunus trituberculatus]
MRHEKSGSWIQDSLTTSEQPPAVKWHPRTLGGTVMRLL